MKIQKMLSQNRRDFRAIFECESCGYTCEKSGYDDDYFHTAVIPKMLCEKCGAKSPENYRPNATKYPAGFVV